MRLEELLRGITVKKICGGDIRDIFISGIRTDSRIIEKDELFVALEGENFDGHEYLREARKNGAIAAICQREVEDVAFLQIVVEDTREALSLLAANFYDNPQEKLKIIGVTGTNGKTTTCHFLASVLKNAGKKTGIIGTLGAYYGGAEIAPDLTTPDPLVLFRIFSDMQKNNVEYVVMEVSAHAVWYKKIVSVRFAACVFTNCTQDHLDFFGTMDRYRTVKKSFFSDGNYDFAVVNTDDSTGKEIVKNGKNFKSYGLNEPADNFAVAQEETLDGTRILFNLEDELADVKLNLTGRYNVYNALAAAACARYLGIDEKSISVGLEAVKKVPGRLENLGSVHGGLVFVDFAHTPDGLENVLTALKERCEGNLLCVFGCGGNRDVSKRPLMGEIAGRLADFSVITSDNPRYEEPYAIIAAIETGYRKYSRNYVVVQDRKKAIEYAMRRLREKDVLLIAGKGGENYQEIMGIKYDYNDNAVVKDIIKKMSTE